MSRLGTVVRIVSTRGRQYTQSECSHVSPGVPEQLLLTDVSPVCLVFYTASNKCQERGGVTSFSYYCRNDKHSKCCCKQTVHFIYIIIIITTTVIREVVFFSAWMQI